MRFPYVVFFIQLGQRIRQHLTFHDVTLTRPSLSHLAHEPELLPLFVQHSPVAMRYLHMLGSLDWDGVPSRVLLHQPPLAPLPYAPFLAACLVKVDQQICSMTRLRAYLVDHPALTWVLGFPLVASSEQPWGFDVARSLPTARHFTRMLRHVPNAVLQGLLDGTVSLLKTALPPTNAFGRAISLDTKHILAWVTENNPKAFVPTGKRYDKTRQPQGDPDCRLGCKKRVNQHAASSTPPTPTANPVPASTAKVGQWYWGYATGVVATKVPDWGEFVLAEFTQSFDCSDVSFFFPLMEATSRRLGSRPLYGAFDAAFDAFYVYEYFHTDDGPGFAAVPRVERGPAPRRAFNEEGLPLCPAGLAMPLRSTFWAKTSLIPHQKGRYGCPKHTEPHATVECPIAHPKSATGGCVTTMPTSIGARIRHQLDRDSPAYKAVYTQRTATERINSQAVNLGIERPRLRNGQAIANHNTLIYLVINLRALQRVRAQHARRQTVTTSSDTGDNE